MLSKLFCNTHLICAPSGLSLGVVHHVLSYLPAKPKGKAVLHADVGVLPGLPQRPGVPEVTVEMCLQELCLSQHEDHGLCTAFSSVFFYYMSCFDFN